jgi:NADPH:quinone reductase-like Zn-dependent oxidoreductase
MMTWQKISISRFGGPEVMELTEQPTIPDPGPDEVRIKVLAAGTGFTDIFIRRGRYPDYKGPVPFTPGYDIVGIVDKVGPGVAALHEGQMVADLCVVGGYTQYAIRPAQFLVPVPDGVDAAEAVCIPLAYLTAFQMLTRYRQLSPGATILAIGASGTVGTALLDLARHFGLNAIGTCSAANLAVVESFGAKAIDYRDGDFVEAVRKLTAAEPNAHKGRAGVDAAFDAIGGAHFARSFACLASGGLLVGYGSQTVADGREGLLSAGLGLARLHSGARSGSCSAVDGRCGTASPRDERSNRKSSRPTWPHCLPYCAMAPSIPSSSIAYPWQPRAKSIPASTAADSAAKSF